MQQEADRRGISVASTEVDDRERDTVAQFNQAINPAPTPQPTATPEGGVPTSVPTVAATPDTSDRAGLDDGFLIKENHIRAAGGISPAVHAARRRASPGQLMVDTVLYLEGERFLSYRLAGISPRTPLVFLFHSPGQPADGGGGGDRRAFRRHSRLELIVERFTRHTGVVLPLDRVDVDTDQIIPKQFLKSISRTGFDKGLFYDWRYRPDGTPNHDFIMNDQRYGGATVLVSGRNFGSGSSREHAPWALQQYGFHAVIAPSFADIFRNNSYQNGFLPVVVPERTVREILDRALASPGYSVTIDLEQQTISDDRDTIASFDIDPAVKHRLLNGLDDIGLTLQHADDISAFEARRPDYLPRTVSTA